MNGLLRCTIDGTASSATGTTSTSTYQASASGVNALFAAPEVMSK